MANFARRALGAIMRMFDNAGDPVNIATALQMFVRTVAGTKQLFAMDSSGVITQGTPYFGLSKGAMYMADDFVNTTTSQSNVAGGGSNVFTTAAAGSPGIATQSVATAASANANLRQAGASQTIIAGANVLVFNGRCRTTTAQDGTDQWSDRWGMADQSGSLDATDGVYFESDRAVNGDNNVRLCTANAGARTKTSMGVAPTVGTFERWTAIVNAAGTSVQGYLNGTATGAAVTGTIPASTVAFCPWALQLVKTLGTNARTVDRDYAECYQIYSPTTR